MNDFLSIIAVQPSSNNCSKDIRDALWISLNTCASRAFLDITEAARIWPLKEEVTTLLFWIFKTLFVAGFVCIKMALSWFLKYCRYAPLSDFAQMGFIRGGNTEGIVIGKYEYLFLSLSITSLSVPHRKELLLLSWWWQLRYIPFIFIEGRVVFVVFCIESTTTPLVIACIMSPAA